MATLSVPAFTIFTPTYNRRHTLERAYRSLQAQTCRDFEWLIVDDGSEDGTAQLVGQWSEADFPIRYQATAHRGKHLAFNLAFELARGEFFLNLDSDDELLPHCLERCQFHWSRLAPEARQRYCSLLFLVSYDSGPVGSFPHEDFDSTLLDITFKHRLATDYQPCFRTEVFRDYRFEDVPGAVHVLEGTVFLELSRRFRSRGINESLLRVHQNPVAGQQLTTLPTFRNAAGFAHYYRYMLNANLDYFRWWPWRFFLFAAYYRRFSWLGGVGSAQQRRQLRPGPARWLWTAAWPLALAMHGRDRRRMSRYPSGT